MTALDHSTMVAMGRAMAATNGYRPLQSGDLARKPGTEIDWLYGSQRVFAFTFELFPRSGRNVADFYPPDEVIARETERNRDALLYLIDLADCPYRAVGKAAGYCGPLYDDLEIDRGWTVDPYTTDTATSGAWRRADPAASARQLGNAVSGRDVLVTGPSRGRDVDGGRTTVRSRFVHLPAGQAATLRLRYWAGMSGAAGLSDGLRIEVVGRGTSPVRVTALAIRGDGSAQAPAWRSLRVPLPPSLRGQDVAVLLTAIDAGTDAVVEAGVDDVRITVAGP